MMSLVEERLTTNPCSDVVVVTHERIERPHLHPANTQVLIGVTEEAADVRTDHRNAVQLKR